MFGNPLKPHPYGERESFNMKLLSCRTSLDCCRRSKPRLCFTLEIRNAVFFMKHCMVLDISCPNVLIVPSFKLEIHLLDCVALKFA